MLKLYCGAHNNDVGSVQIIFEKFIMEYLNTQGEK